MTQFLKEYGERLVELGYRIVPIPPGRKGPNRKGWPAFQPDANQVRQWYSNGSAQDGVGVIAATCPAIDVDILDPEVAQLMSDEIDRIFAGQSLMTRTGRAPKFLVPFRSDTPFRKMFSATYTDGTHDHKVEILGDGQQWVAYHVHPDTGKPYEWWDGLGDAGIGSVHRSELPALTSDDARRVIDAFERIAAGMVASGKWTRKSVVADSRPDDRPDDPFAGHAQPVGLTIQQLEKLVRALPNDDGDYEQVWFPTLASIHAEFGDEGMEHARTWSMKSVKHTDERFEKTWHSLGNYKGALRTVRSLIQQLPKEERLLLEQKPMDGDFVQISAFATQQRVEWHIKHVLPKRSVVVVYGAPGSSKSFFVLDLVAHIARGIEWRGNRTRQCPVAYIAAEGVAGFGNRLKAYGIGHGVDLATVPMYVRGGVFDLKQQFIDASDKVNQIGAGVVVIDTLAAVTPGANENTSEDMGMALDAANRIVQNTGATVILIHHTNKNGDMRGWSGLLGNTDTILRIERKDGLRTAHMEKQKDDSDSGEYGYRLKVVDLYEDEDGDTVTSCIVEPSEEIAPVQKREKRSTGGDFETSEKYAKARHYFHVIEEIVGLGDANVEESDVIVAIQQDKTVNPLCEQDYPKASNIKRTLLTLAEKGKIRREGRWIRVCR